ncbi:MAG: hypothetical protein AAFQ90_01510 [Pseudomonadota bacterium]
MSDLPPIAATPELPGAFVTALLRAVLDQRQSLVMGEFCPASFAGAAGGLLCFGAML